MRFIVENARASLRVRQWQKLLASDPSDTAEAIVLGYVLNGWLTDLNFRLGYTEPYGSEAERQGKLRETTHYINWCLDRIAEEMPEGQSMVSGEDRVLFELLRDAGLDITMQMESGFED